MSGIAVIVYVVIGAVVGIFSTVGFLDWSNKKKVERDCEWRRREALRDATRDIQRIKADNDTILSRLVALEERVAKRTK